MLCTQADVEKQLQTSGLDAPTVTYLIENATQLIRDHCDQHLEDQPGLEVTLDGSGAAWLFLHEIPVRAVSSVVEDGTPLTEGASEDFLWYSHGALLRVGARWTSKPQSVVVTYDAGYETVPSALRAVCAAMVARAFQAGAAALSGDGSSGERPLSSESIINYSVTYAEVSYNVAAAHLYVSDEDKGPLAHYVKLVVA